jgi:hypothetical protein
VVWQKISLRMQSESEEHLAERGFGTTASIGGNWKSSGVGSVSTTASSVVAGSVSLSSKEISGSSGIACPKSNPSPMQVIFSMSDGTQMLTQNNEQHPEAHSQSEEHWSPP